MKNAIPLAFGVAFAALAVTSPAAATDVLSQDQAAAPVEAPSPSSVSDAGMTSSATIAPPAVATPSVADPFAQAVRLSDGDLDQNRGGESIVVGNQTLRAITSGNILNGNYTAGDISISNGALSNFAGLGNFAINTGAQVSLQSGMNLTINIEQ